MRPKIPIDRVMFLITYAMDPKNWRRDPVVLDRDDDCLEAIVFAFAHRTRQAIQRGLLQGYRREEDALNTVRGRIRFGDQIGRRFAVPLPIEVAYDEYTEDIEKNRLLKTAIHLLGHTFIRSEAARQEVRRLRPAFATVGLGSYQRGALPEVRYTRLDEHYRPAVELARLIIENSSLELLHGKVAGAAFLIDMNKVFERFLYVALGEVLGLPRTPMETRGDAHAGRGQPHLDEAGLVVVDSASGKERCAASLRRRCEVQEARPARLRAPRHLPDARLLHGGRSAFRYAGLRRRRGKT